MFVGEVLVLSEKEKILVLLWRRCHGGGKTGLAALKQSQPGRFDKDTLFIQKEIREEIEDVDFMHLIYCIAYHLFSPTEVNKRSTLQGLQKVVL